MFPDSQIAKSFKLAADKIRYTANFGIAPYFNNLLVDDVKKTDCYVTSFDETLNAITQSCEMDIIIRFSNNSTNRVDVRYWNSNFLVMGLPLIYIENLSIALNS